MVSALFDFEFWMFDFSPQLRGFLAAVALQRQPYLSVDNLRPNGGEIRRVGRFRPRGCGGFWLRLPCKGNPTEVWIICALRVIRFLLGVIRG